MASPGAIDAPPTSPPPQPHVPPPFLDVPALLELSQPQPRVNWFWYAAAFFAMVVVGSTMASRQSPQAHQAVELLSLLLLIGLMAVLTMATMFTVRRHRA